MGGLASDRSTRVVLALALVCAAALAAARLWAEGAEAPESWWRLRWAAGVGAAALAVAAAAAMLAWRRRSDAARALPLAAAAALLLASVAAAL
jgi:cytochrome bd-type quinol oxidase subunit 1